MIQPVIRTGKPGRPAFTARIGRRDYMKQQMRDRRAQAKEDAKK